MNNKTTNIIAAIILVFVFIVTVSSIAGDSLTMDEQAHLPAGYSYITQQDMRINPEHPPLVKDLAGIPSAFMSGIKFPYDLKAWKDDVNGQWAFGSYLLFKMGNPADQMIFWGRIPMILMLLLLAFFVFKWTRELYGNKAALIALFLAGFSPTLLAHGRLVTTDVGAATGAIIALYYFVKYLKNHNRGNLIKAGLAFGLAELLKFSMILLFPTIAILVFAWALCRSSHKLTFFLKSFVIWALRAVGIVLVGFCLIWVVYQFHTWNYPPERQVSDTAYNLSSFGSRAVANTITWMADKPMLRPLAQYFLGVAMVLQRVSGGNTTYFMGEVSAAGWKDYFPIVYAIKEPLPFHILSLIALFYALYLIKKPFNQSPYPRIKLWLSSHISEFAILTFVAIYWTSSLTGNLNIGVRHLIPVFPLTMILVAGITAKWLKPPLLNAKRVLLGLLIVWQAAGVIFVYPNFLAYFNEIAGGPDKGYLYTVDSNLDWGQDLKRLTKWVEENNVEQIYVDYFGGADAQYYLKDKFMPWWGQRDPSEMPVGGYIAVSATFLQGGRGYAKAGSDLKTGYYDWLNDYTPVAKIGYSIFVYKIDGDHLVLK